MMPLGSTKKDTHQVGISVAESALLHFAHIAETFADSCLEFDSVLESLGRKRWLKPGAKSLK